VETVSFWLVDLVPWVLANLIDLNSMVWIRVEDLTNHIFCLLREKIRKIILSIEDFLVEIGCFLVLERKIAAEHGVKYNAATPEVAHETIIPLAGNHFRRSIAWTSTGRLQC
jgi:hypothetical protein